MSDLFSYAPAPKPETAPHARGSRTSREAAERIVPAIGPDERTILRALANAGERGLTCQECEIVTDIEHTTCSARLRGLELKGRVRKTAETRLTRRKRKATVYRAVEARA